MTTRTYPLRLPASIKAAVELLAREEGVSMNQFVRRRWPRSWWR